MSAVKGKSGGKKGGGKSSSSAGPESVKTKTIKLLTKRDLLVKLRGCIRDELGRDKLDFGLMDMLMKYNKNSVNASISLTASLNPRQLKQAFALSKTNMLELYENSEYGWDDEDKESELTEKSARFLICMDGNELVAFAHFRFTQIGECINQAIGCSCIYVYDIQVASSSQTKGLGSHLLALITLMAKKSRVTAVCLPVTSGNSICENWLVKRGYSAYCKENDKDVEWEQGGDVYVALQDEEDQVKMYTKIIMGPPVEVVLPAVSVSEKKVVVKKEKESSIDKLKHASPLSVMEVVEVVEVKKEEVVVAQQEEENEIEAPASASGSWNLPTLGSLNIVDDEFDESEFLVTENGEDENEEDEVLDSLREEFTVRHGREPTTEEIREWMIVLKEAAEEAAVARVVNGFGGRTSGNDEDGDNDVFEGGGNDVIEPAE